jgi:HEAT repeats/HEAT repeat
MSGRSITFFPDRSSNLGNLDVRVEENRIMRGAREDRCMRGVRGGERGACHPDGDPVLCRCNASVYSPGVPPPARSHRGVVCRIWNFSVMGGIHKVIVQGHMREEGITMKTAPSSEGPLKEGIRALEATVREDPDPRMRRYSCFLLGTLTGPDAIRGLISALHDPEKEVRAQAASALGEVGIAALPDLVPLLRDPEWRVRYRAAEAIGSIHSDRACQALLGALADERDHVRYMAAKGLGRIGNRNAVTSLAPLLNDENPFVRKSAATALGLIGGEAAGNALHNALYREVSDQVKPSIEEALEKIEGSE